MEKEKLEFVKGKTQELLQSQTCCAEGKAAAKAAGSHWNGTGSGRNRTVSE